MTRPLIAHTQTAPDGHGEVTIGCWNRRAHLQVRVPAEQLPPTACVCCGRRLRPGQHCWADTATLTEPLCATCHNQTCGPLDVA